MVVGPRCPNSLHSTPLPFFISFFLRYVKLIAILYGFRKHIMFTYLFNFVDSRVPAPNCCRDPFIPYIYFPTKEPFMDTKHNQFNNNFISYYNDTFKIAFPFYGLSQFRQQARATY